MDYVAPRNYQPTVTDPRPPYPDGNKAAGTKGAIPSGKSIEHPIREIIHCIEQAGLEPNGNDLTQLWQAILAAVAAGGGSGTPPPVVDFSFTPMFPEVVSNAGLFMLTPSSGQIIVADGTTFVHRGGNKFLTTSTPIGTRTFLTSPSKVYHLRWRYNGGAPAYSLKDLADGAYNPGTLADAYSAFDTTYDDMLIARVETNSANALTVTPLLNLNNLGLSQMIAGVNPLNHATDQTRFDFVHAMNWSRAPKSYSLTMARRVGPGEEYVRLNFNIRPQGTSDANLVGLDALYDVNRYRISQAVAMPRATAAQMLFSARG